MSNQPDAAWVEAAQKAADRTYDALAGMGDFDLNLQLVNEDEALTTNSVDKDFLDYLARGDHLNEKFLSGAK